MPITNLDWQYGPLHFHLGIVQTLHRPIELRFERTVALDHLDARQNFPGQRVTWFAELNC